MTSRRLQTTELVCKQTYITLAQDRAVKLLAQRQEKPCSYVTRSSRLKLKEEKGLNALEFSSEELVARINRTRAGSISDALDITIVLAEKEKVIATMPVGPNQRQQVGYLHGGAS